MIKIRLDGLTLSLLTGQLPIGTPHPQRQHVILFISFIDETPPARDFNYLRLDSVGTIAMMTTLLEL